MAIFKISVYFYVVMFAIQIILYIGPVISYFIAINVNLGLIFPNIFGFFRQSFNGIINGIVMIRISVFTAFTAIRVGTFF